MMKSSRGLVELRALTPVLQHSGQWRILPEQYSKSLTSLDRLKTSDLRLVVPSGIEPLPTASEAIVLSIGPRDQCACAEAEWVTGLAGLGKGRISISQWLMRSQADQNA
jgi:hypothetical protein